MAAVHARQSFLQTPTLHSILQLSDTLPELQIEPRFFNIRDPRPQKSVTFQAFKTLLSLESSNPPFVKHKNSHVVSKHVDIAGLFGRVSQLLGNPKLWAKCDDFKQKLSMNHLPISSYHYCKVPWSIPLSSAQPQWNIYSCIYNSSIQSFQAQTHLAAANPAQETLHDGPDRCEPGNTHQSASKDMAPLRFPLLRR